MGKIINQNDLTKLTLELAHQDKRIVLAGGCFDLLHPGHILFLEAAKKEGDTLIVLLESDEAVTKRKGKGRPVQHQEDRARILSALIPVDYIIPLSGTPTDQAYDELILALKPAIIATSKADHNRHHKERQSSLTGAKVVEVIDREPRFSTTSLLKRLSI